MTTVTSAMLLCLLGLHSWKRIGVVKPIRKTGEFMGGRGLCDGHFALGECRRCGIRSMRECGGRFQWYSTDEVTKEEYMVKFESGEYAQEDTEESNRGGFTYK